MLSVDIGGGALRNGLRTLDAVDELQEMHSQLARGGSQRPWCTRSWQTEKNEEGVDISVLVATLDVPEATKNALFLLRSVMKSVSLTMGS